MSIILDHAVSLCMHHLQIFKFIKNMIWVTDTLKSTEQRHYCLKVQLLCFFVENVYDFLHTISRLSLLFSIHWNFYNSLRNNSFSFINQVLQLKSCEGVLGPFGVS